ncbi:sericin 1-like [Teleopsis dalmanni]|uniref:sericin 1-like n=1 Tax=Teleopsis dalmanni TaxID=139649 RepID=UPI0018CD968D|nr:sericin 1-like [Teleopsis dalmanni]
MSSHSGTIGRKRGGSSGSEYYFNGGEQMRRQRSAEWHSRHGYSSSEDEYQNTGQASAFDTQLLAQLLLQSQQLANMDRYGSDCDNEEIPASLLSDYTSTNRENSNVHLLNQQLQQSTGLCSPMKQQTAAIATTAMLTTTTTANSKYQTNANLGLIPSNTRSTNPFLNTKYDSQSNSDSLSEHLSYSGSAAMLDRLQAASDFNASNAATTLNSAYLMPNSTTAGSLTPTIRETTARTHRSKSGRTLNRASGMTSSSSGTSSTGNASSSTAAVASAVAAAIASRTEREKLKLQQIQMELREFAQSTAESSGASALGVADLDEFGGIPSGGESEPPPEPAPPEIPPRTQSLLLSFRKHSDYKLKYEEKGDQKHEEFIPTSQLQQQYQKDFLTTENSRSSESQSKSIASSDSQSQQGNHNF